MDELYLTLLNKAITYESDAADMYKDLSKRTSFREVQRLFTQLCIDEDRHKRILISFRDSGDYENAVLQVNNENILAEIMDINNNLIKMDVMQVKDAINTAMAFENKSYLLYKEALDAYTEPNIHKLLLTLSQMEKEHYDLLQNMLNTL